MRDVRADRQLPAGSAATVESVASELVENMVRHAATPGRLRLKQHPASLSVAVYDSAEQPPRLIDLSDTGRPGGRGIATVAALASAWGHNPRRPTGKVVWAVLPFPLGVAGWPHPAPNPPTAALPDGSTRSGLTIEQLWLAASGWVDRCA